MKVVLTSNWNNESIAEVTLTENLDEIQAEQKAQEYNEGTSDGSTYYAVVKPDDYRLWRGMADLV